MTQEELAEAVGAHFTTINRLENGKQGLSEKWIGKLAAVLEVHPGDLLAGSDAEAPPRSMGMREEAEIFQPPPKHWSSGVKLKDHQFFYRLKSNALDAIDIPAGALAIADFGADAVAQAKQERNIVTPCLIQYHFDAQDFSKVLTLPRQFIPPRTAIRNSTDGKPQPIILGDGRADIIAVLTSVIRDI